MRPPKVDKDDPRVRSAVVVGTTGLVLAVAGIAWDVVMGDANGGNVAAHALSALGLVISAGGQARLAFLRRSISSAINVPVELFVAFSRATGSSDDFSPPGWLTGFGIAALVLLVAAAVPFVVYIVSREQDERERKIAMTAMSLSFLATLLTVLAFVLLDQNTAVQPPSMTWILAVGAASWFASYFVLKERM